MSKYDKRLERLERIYGLAACTCTGTGPGLIVLREWPDRQRDPEPPQDPPCPVHGRVDRMVVVVRKFFAVRKADQEARATGAGAVMPDGRVAVTLPSPSRSTHQCTEETDHGPMG